MKEDELPIPRDLWREPEFSYIEYLESFIADMEPSKYPSASVEDIGIFVVRGSERHKLWQKLHLQKYPGNY